MDVALPLLLLLAIMSIGMPVGFALAISGAFGIWLVTDNPPSVYTILQATPVRLGGDYILTTIPMFVLLAYVMSAAGITGDLYRTVANWLSWARGGLATATVVASAVFGGLSGATTAAASAMSNIAVPSMREHGYADRLSTGTVAVGSTLSVLIPPSILMIVYGSVTETSIGQLLVAGILPGVLLAFMFIVTIQVWVRLKPEIAPGTFSVAWSERWRSLATVWPAVLLIMAILGLLYSGIVTPTEVGAAGAFVGTVFVFAMRRLTIRGFLGAATSTVQTTTMIFVIIMGATIFGRYLSLARLPQDLGAFITELDVNRWVIIAIIVAGYFVLSMFMDELPLLMLTLPITFPLITQLGFDPVWFGVMSMLMVAMGLVFPPVGICAFIVAAASRVDVMTVFRGTAILVIPIILTTILLMIFPAIALWIPGRM